MEISKIFLTLITNSFQTKLGNLYLILNALAKILKDFVRK